MIEPVSYAILLVMIVMGLVLVLCLQRSCEWDTEPATAMTEREGTVSQ